MASNQALPDTLPENTPESVAATYKESRKYAADSTKLSEQIDKALDEMVAKRNAKFRTLFVKAKSHSDKVALCLANKDITEQLDSIVVASIALNRQGTLPKKWQTSDVFRKQGNQWYEDPATFSPLHTAILYDKAVTNAPTAAQLASENNYKQEALQQLPFAYGNRSAIYYRLGEYHFALLDIQGALESGYAKYKSPLKLQLRQVDCLTLLGRVEEARVLLEQIAPLCKGPDGEQWKKLKEAASKPQNKDSIKSQGDSITLAMIHSEFISTQVAAGKYQPHPKMPSINAKLTMHYDPVAKRHKLIARELIKPGELLTVSQPYISLVDSRRDFCEHCHRNLYNNESFESNHRTVPCTNCCKVLFCSEHCREQASFHRFECDIMPILTLNERWHLALRILFTVGLDQVRKVAQQDSSVDLLVEPIGYFHLFHLCSPLVKKMSTDELIREALIACMLLRFCKLAPGFLTSDNEDAFIGGIILRHLLITRAHCEILTYVHKERSLLGLAIDPIVGFVHPMEGCGGGAHLVNSVYSMEPAEVKRHAKPPGLTTITAAYPIRAGSELHFGDFLFLTNEDQLMSAMMKQLRT